MKIEQEKNILDLNLIVKTIKSALPQEKEYIPLHEPYFGGNEWCYVKECIDTGWVSSVGKFVDLFEEKLAEFTGVKRAVAVVNGTAALQICLQLVGVKKEDEVLIPALTFIATANAVTYCGAVPHFVDSEERTLGLDALKLRSYLKDIAEVRGNTCYNKITQRRIKAVVPMHTFGHPVDLDELVIVCKEFHLELVEDAAESLGSYYKGQHTGNWGKVSAVSFNGNKVITTGGGGAILTNDVELGKLAKHLTTQAKLAHRWAFEHDMVGYNYRMPNINAALGCAQLEQLPEFLAKKRQLAKKYQTILSKIEGVQVVVEPSFAISNYWLNAILLAPEHAGKKDDLLALTNDLGILTRPVWNLIYTLPMFTECPRMDCQMAESIATRLINIPSSVNL
ncbi:perosamine synthetase [Pelosinus fermentans]|uniref:LegC family aminotransferase n=1 Tax=Pelosinus fermentans TaxID=365349 RepID=UPI0002685C22|nr:LegC family aminotransferase [Pelosinus fermentans]OAM92776.1 Aminotransferase, LLPSF_NHT_00031 family [Pelosinus fermentans DSM 17108]SDQ56488.1 perosamine synthetase [Pelosinus fermentans]